MADYKLVIKISDLLLDITDLGNANDISNGDLQGILEAKARQIIKIVKE